MEKHEWEHIKFLFQEIQYKIENTFEYCVFEREDFYNSHDVIEIKFIPKQEDGTPENIILVAKNGWRWNYTEFSHYKVPLNDIEKNIKFFNYANPDSVKEVNEAKSEILESLKIELGQNYCEDWETIIDRLIYKSRKI